MKSLNLGAVFFLLAPVATDYLDNMHLTNIIYQSISPMFLAIYTKIVRFSAGSLQKVN